MSAASTLFDRLAPPLDVRSTLEINAVGLATIPVLAFIGPRVLENSDRACRIRIDLGYRTRNHMGSMYFGVLCCGADVVSGLPVIRLMRGSGKFLVPSFKDIQADFLERATGDVVFENLDLPAIAQAYEAAVNSGERVNLPVHSRAMVGDEEVARFTTTLSLKYKADAKLPFVQRVLSAIP